MIADAIEAFASWGSGSKIHNFQEFDFQPLTPLTFELVLTLALRALIVLGSK
ncbi:MULTISPECIES: hypothetical protein [Rhizobium/Agrobacterium group]|uniref:hypothetical protein n=1 Tax=Rhizobium/Agrobacterium group TaxID=227290 RepID=UPI001404D2D6|nr:MULTISPECIES: hypothetical protein [Rhizobium/Agrobacterium group]